MNKLQLFLIFIAFIAKSTAQQTKPIINGQVLCESTALPLQGVHIQNEGSSYTAITDSEGKFTIIAEEKNVLKFSFVGKQTLFRVITKVDLEENQPLLEIKMKDEVTELEEVEVVKYKNLTAQGLGILSYEPIKRTYNEKRDYTNNRIMGSSPLSINVLAIVNMLNGNRKLYKQYVKNEKNLNVAIHIKENFSDFLRKKLGLTEEEVEVLAYSVMEKSEFHSAIAKKDDKRIQELLAENWFEYQQSIQEGIANNLKNSK